MAWGYDPALKEEKDQVRFLIQDTNSARQLFADEEIAWSLTQEANVYMAAAALCDILVTKAGGGTGGVKKKKISEFQIEYDTQLYVRLGAMYRSRGYGHQVPYAGGISVADKTSQQQDTDWVNPKIVRDLDQNPAAPQPQVPRNNPLEQI